MKMRKIVVGVKVGVVARAALPITNAQIILLAI